jgi:ribosomal protein S13
MKFEQLLQVYWSKGFYFAGRMRSFNMTIDEFFLELAGLGKHSKFLFIKRFEFGYYRYKPHKEVNLTTFTSEQRKVINMYFSQMTSVSHDIEDLLRYNLIRLYLIKTFRGKSQALGKPSRGQRTWSNASTASQLASPLKTFINDMKKTYFKKKTPESKNKKILKKKIKISTKVKIKQEKKKNNLWF